MMYIHNTSINAYFNAALEQYLLHEFDDDIFMLWQNENAVVLGKHQVAYKEVNYPYCSEHGVQVVRRITGGGTVYHDMGNVNFTFIDRIEDSTKLIDFKRYLEPIKEALQRMGINAVINAANDLTLDGMKISGNAEHVFSQKKKVIHHGTLLYGSKLETLGIAIEAGSGKFESKGVNSNRSKVTNINNNTPQTADTQAFINRLKEEILGEAGFRHYVLSDDDISAVSSLQKQKFETWEWNYGYSPAYTFTRKNVFEKAGYNCLLKVKDGNILTAQFGENLDMKTVEVLQGVPHNLIGLKNVLPQLELGLGFSIDEKELMQLMH
jgi:lipoate---protein ligase